MWQRRPAVPVPPPLAAAAPLPRPRHVRCPRHLLPQPPPPALPPRPATTTPTMTTTLLLPCATTGSLLLLLLPLALLLLTQRLWVALLRRATPPHRRQPAQLPRRLHPWPPWCTPVCALLPAVAMLVGGQWKLCPSHSQSSTGRRQRLPPVCCTSVAPGVCGTGRYCVNANKKVARSNEKRTAAPAANYFKSHTPSVLQQSAPWVVCATQWQRGVFDRLRNGKNSVAAHRYETSGAKTLAPRGQVQTNAYLQAHNHPQLQQRMEDTPIAVHWCLAVSDSSGDY